jgi:hypothetical protein
MHFRTWGGLPCGPRAWHRRERKRAGCRHTGTQDAEQHDVHQRRRGRDEAQLADAIGRYGYNVQLVSPNRQGHFSPT